MNIRMPPFHLPRKSTPVRAEETSSQVLVRLGRESSSRARYEIKEKAPSFAGVVGGTRGTRCPPTKTCPLSGYPIADPSLFRPQARDTPAIMRSFHPSANESAESLQARRTSSSFRGRATPTKHHVARVRVARAFAELREPGARENGRLRACERSKRHYLAAEDSPARDIFLLRRRGRDYPVFFLPRAPRTASFVVLPDLVFPLFTIALSFSSREACVSLFGPTPSRTRRRVLCKRSATSYCTTVTCQT